MARRGGVEPGFVDRLIEWGIVGPGSDGRFSPGDVRRVKLMDTLERAGVALDMVASVVHDGRLSLDFLDAAQYEVIGLAQPQPVRPG